MLRNLQNSIKSFLDKKNLEKQIFEPDHPEMFSKPIISKKDDDLVGIMQLMQHHKVYRVYIVDDDGKPIRVISLSDIIRPFLSK